MSRVSPLFGGALTLLVLAGTGAPAGAQKVVGYDPAPGVPVHIDLATGTITRGPEVRERSSPTCVSFDNLDLSGFATTDTGACVVEWFTAGNKSAGKSGIVSGFDFAYGSTAADTNNGGPGGQLQISFRAGYVKGAVNAAGITGTEIARYMISGLPANTACTDATNPTVVPFAGLARATIFPALCLPDGPFGYSWKFTDIGNDGQAKTFPRLACIADCTGPGPDALGMTNSVDRYLGSAYLDTIALPGTGTFDSSMSIRLLELPVVPAASVVDNGTGVNPSILSSTSRPRIDRTWGVSVDCTGANPTRSALFRIGFLGVFGTPVPSGFGELIILPNPGQGFLLPHNGGVANLQAPIPKDANLVCLSYAVQALCFDTPRGYLSNALVETVGTP